MNAGFLKSTVATACSMLLFSCTIPSRDELLSADWQPVTIGETTVSDDIEIFVDFGTKGKVSGNSGCNSYFADFKASITSLQIRQLASTRKACPGEIMALEDAFTGALQAAACYKIDANNLVLLDENDVVIMTLRRRDAD